MKMESKCSVFAFIFILLLSHELVVSGSSPYDEISFYYLPHKLKAVSKKSEGSRSTTPMLNTPRHHRTPPTYRVPPPPPPFRRPPSPPGSYRWKVLPPPAY